VKHAARTITIPLSWAFALIAALTCALCLSMAIGAAPAYAGENAPAVDGAAAVAGTDPAAATANPVADPKTDSSTNNSAVNANAAVTNAPATTTTETTSVNANTNNGLGAAAGPSTYASDDGSDDIFIGLQPVETDTQATSPYGDLPAGANLPAAVNGNPVYVGVSATVGQGVDLAVMVDYMRVNNDTYGVGDTAVLPTTIPGGGTATNADTYHYAMNWYFGDTPIQQGVYYTDLSEYQRVTGLTSAGSAQPIAVSGRAGASAFVSDSSAGIPDPYGRFKFDTLYRVTTNSYGCSFAVGSTNSVEACERHLRYLDATQRDREIILLFESSGPRTVTAQATLTRKIVNGGNVSYVVYASVPVVFYIDVKSANQGTFTVGAMDQSAVGIDISGFYNYDTNTDAEFETTIFKKYKHINDYAEDSDDALWFEGEYAAGKNYVALWEGNTHKKAAAGKYKIVAQHKTGKYKKLVATFVVEDSEFANGASVARIVVLQDPSAKSKYAVRFVDENGDELLAERLYDEDTPGSSVACPTTTPTKEGDGVTVKYAFLDWQVVEQGEYSHTSTPLDVTGNFTYKAYYSKIPLSNITSASGVSASGGLFNDDLTGSSICSYELSVVPLGSSTTYVPASTMEIIGPSNTVLDMYRVVVTQHNHDGTTAWVTTNVGAMSLTLKVSGVADGTKVKVVQVHDSTGPSDPADTITHTGTVKNGEVTITVPNKLSTFIVTTNLEAQGEQEGTSDDPSGDMPSGDDSSSSTTPEQSGDSTNTNTPSAETSGQESGAAGDNANDPAASGDEAVTRGVPAADPELGADGVLADGPGEDVDDAVAEGVKAAPGTDDVKTPETGDSPLAPLVLVVVAVLACVVATRNGVLWARSRR